MVERAVELGINYFDNAPDYGNGVAEENLGRVLKELKLRPVITSKVEVRHENLVDIAGHVVRSTEESLERLGVDYVDILQIHNGPAPSLPPLAGRSYTQLWIEDYLRPGGALEGPAAAAGPKPDTWGSSAGATMPTRCGSLLILACFYDQCAYTLLNPTAGWPGPEGWK